MRGKRSKQYRKLMQQYGLHFGFREPYQVLVDATILQDAARFKMDFVGGMSKALHGEIKPMITQCCIRHLYDSEPRDSIVTEHAKGFERRRCNHHELEKPLSALECMTSVVDPKGTKNNKHRYVVACQDERLRAYLRTIPGVPLIYLKRSVMIMEPMAGATEDVRDRDERAKFRSGLKGKRNPEAPGEKAKRNEAQPGHAVNANKARLDTSGGNTPLALPLPSESSPEKKKRKRGPSGPNPLSIKKPKRTAKNSDSQSAKHVVHANDRTHDASADDGAGPVTADHDQSTTEAKRKRKRRHKTGKENSPTPGGMLDDATIQDA